MGDPYVRNLGHVVAMDESLVVVGVDYDAVVINADSAPLTRSQAEEFGQLFVAACWEAGENRRCMREEVHEADGGDTMAHVSFPLEVRYAYPDAGWEGDRNAAAEHLVLGVVYTIQTLTVGQSTSYFTFHGVAGKFNTVLFAPVTDDGHG